MRPRPRPGLRRLLSVLAGAALLLATALSAGASPGAAAATTSAVPPKGTAGAPSTVTATAPSGAAVPGAAAPAADPCPADTGDFPPGQEAFHTYAEMCRRIHRVADAHPGIVRVFSIGDSYQGRPIWAAEVSDHVGQDEGEPEVLIDGLHHADEHMSAEMTLAILGWLADGYGSDARITDIVDTRRTWIVFMVNPDGGEYDRGTGAYRDWRKNRQPTPGSSQKGTDVNRNYGFFWGCCGGASHDPSSSKYAGPAAFSTPEARAIRDFVEGRVVDGRQRIRVALSFHTFGRLVLWPYGFTKADVPPQMTQRDHDVLVALGRSMAKTNGYTPEQSSDLYLSSGTSTSWLYGTQRIFAYTIEMTGAERAPATSIGRETKRNREAVLRLMEVADCPYRAIGKETAWCGPFADDLEIPRGWTRNPDGSDTATAGRWSLGAPGKSPFQRTDAASGMGVLVTGRRTGDDVDGGRTTIRSPRFTLPAGAAATLRLRYWVGLDAKAGPGEGLVVRLVDARGVPIPGAETLLEVDGDGADHAPAWTTLAAALPASTRGTTVAIELVARDGAGDGDATVEAGVDDVRVTVG